MLKFLLCHIHFIQSYYNNGAIFSVYWLGPQTKIFPSSWFCLKEALHCITENIENIEIIETLKLIFLSLASFPERIFAERFPANSSAHINLLIFETSSFSDFVF